MKVLFYSPLAILSHHFETDLELIKKHQDLGHEVYVIGCDGALKKLNYQGCRGVLRCSSCHSRFKHGMRLLDIGEDQKTKIELSSEEKHNWEYETQKDLRAIKYREVDIGSAVLSTLISNIREPILEIPKLRKQIDVMLSSSAQLVDYIEKVFDEITPDLVYFFNGRFSLFRAVLRVCQLRKIKCFVHERGGQLSRYSLTEDNYPHDLHFMKSKILEFWDKSDLPDPKKLEIGARWFDLRVQGIHQNWFSFTGTQRQGMLPLGFDENKRNIALFVSSEDEFAAIDGWEHPFFKTQIEGFRFILDNCKSDKFHFYFRVHPNLKGLRNSQTKAINELSYPNLTVIQANEQVSSYALINACEKILTFGSTVGIEAIHAKKPSILLGRSLYEDYKTITRPKSKENLIELVHSEISFKEDYDYLKYGFWAQELGYDFKFYKPFNLSSGSFLGEKIYGNKILLYTQYFFLFFQSLKQVLSGRMDFTYLKNRVKNKVGLR
jgi:hypothetical protein